MQKLQSLLNLFITNSVLKLEITDGESEPGKMTEINLKMNVLQNFLSILPQSL